MQLLDCPGADVAYEIRNLNDLTPLDLAEANGYTELSTMLKGYIVSRKIYLKKVLFLFYTALQNMNEFTSMYAKLKEMSLSQKSPEIGETFLEISTYS